MGHNYARDNRRVRRRRYLKQKRRTETALQKLGGSFDVKLRDDPASYPLPVVYRKIKELRIGNRMDFLDPRFYKRYGPSPEMTALCKALREEGTEAILVDADTHIVIEGVRRTLAADSLGFKRIPCCLVHAYDLEQAFRLTMSGTLARFRKVL